jgi:hypothetical protein
MLLRLGKEGTVIRIYKTRAIYFETITMSNGRSRKLFQTEMRKVVEFPIYESADAHMSDLPNEDGEAIFSLHDIQNAERWIERQMQAIEAAFRKNLAMGLMGGTAVIKRSRKDDERYSTYESFILSARAGEFMGVIRGAHSYKPKMRRTLKLPSVEVKESQTAAQAWNDGSIEDTADELIMLIRKTAKERGKPLDKAFTDEEINAMYIAERQPFYMITRAIGRQQKTLNSKLQQAALKKHREIMKRPLA